MVRNENDAARCTKNERIPYVTHEPVVTRPNPKAGRQVSTQLPVWLGRASQGLVAWTSQLNRSQDTAQQTIDFAKGARPAKEVSLKFVTAFRAQHVPLFACFDALS
jgi:hypothetical protein